MRRGDKMWDVAEIVGSLLSNSGDKGGENMKLPVLKKF